MTLNILFVKLKLSYHYFFIIFSWIKNNICHKKLYNNLLHSFFFGYLKQRVNGILNRLLDYESKIKYLKCIIYQRYFDVLICERFRRCIFTSNTDGTYALSVSIFTNNLDAWHIIVGNPWQVLHNLPSDDWPTSWTFIVLKSTGIYYSAPTTEYNISETYLWRLENKDIFCRKSFASISMHTWLMGCFSQKCEGANDDRIE